MTKQEMARLVALEELSVALIAKIAALEAKIEAPTSKPAAPRKVWINPHRDEAPSIAEIVNWRHEWAAKNPGFSQSAIEAAETEWKAAWYAARHAA